MSDLQKAQYNYENYRYCFDNGHQEWLVKAARCFNFWNSKQWDEADLIKLRKARRPALTLNVIEALVRTMGGVQRALRNDVRFSPVSTVPQGGAEAMDATWLHIQAQNQLGFKESEVYLRGLITGRAYYDARVDFDESMRGDLCITAPRAQDVVLDPGALDYDPRTWPQVINRRWTNLLDIEHTWGKEKARALADQGSTPSWFDFDDTAMGRQLGSLPWYTLGFTQGDIDAKLVRAFCLIDRQYEVLKRKDVFIDVNTGDFSEIPETWDREKIGHVLERTPGLVTTRRQVKTVRWTVSCNDVLLHDDDSPYKHFTTIPFFPTFLDGVSMGVVENLIDPQVLYNKVTSQELHIINTTANSGWKSKTGNIRNYTPEQMEEVGSQTGLFLEVDDISQTEKIQPNQVPPAHDRMSAKADNIMRTLSGVSNQSRGFAREDVSGEAITLNQAASDVNFAGPLSNLHRSREILAQISMNCVQTYYTETRVIMINRGSTYRPEFTEMEINGTDAEGAVVNDVTQGKYTTVLVPSPARSQLSEDEFKSLVILRKEVGINIPDDVMIELAPIANKTQLIQSLKGDSNEAQQRIQQLQEQNTQLEQALLEAKADKERSAAELNSARANKARAEAEIDPDAAYERVEQARIASDAAVAREQIASRERIDREKLGLQRRTSDRDTAVKLTQIESENARHTQSTIAKVAAVKAQPPKQPQKPAGGKPGKTKKP